MHLDQATTASGNVCTRHAIAVSPQSKVAQATYILQSRLRNVTLLLAMRTPSWCRGTEYLLLQRLVVGRQQDITECTQSSLKRVLAVYRASLVTRFLL